VNFVSLDALRASATISLQGGSSGGTLSKFPRFRFNSFGFSNSIPKVSFVFWNRTLVVFQPLVELISPIFFSFSYFIILLFPSGVFPTLVVFLAVWGALFKGSS